MNKSPIASSPQSTADSEFESLNVMGRQFFEDCLIFDMADQGRILAARAPACRAHVGESFFSLLSIASREALCSYLFSYDSRIAVIDTALGIALILPHLMPETTLGIALIPDLKRKTLLRLIAREASDRFCMLDEALIDPITKTTKDMRARSDDFQQILRDIARCFEEYPFPCSPPNEHHTAFEATRYLWHFSYFTGCPVHVIDQPRSEELGNLNPSLYAVFVLLSLLLCRSIGTTREAFISLEERNDLATVSVQIPVDPSNGDPSPIVLWLDSLASRKNILFEYSTFRTFLLLRFAPVTYDWAYLGIKQPTVLELPRKGHDSTRKLKNDKKS